jgi:hypothetical protein
VKLFLFIQKIYTQKELDIMDSSSSMIDCMNSSGFDFPDMDMFDDIDEFPIHETLQRGDLDMFSFEGEQTQGQQVVEEAKFFWSANRGSCSSSSCSSSSSTNDANEQSQQHMQNLFQSTIQSTH